MPFKNKLFKVFSLGPVGKKSRELGQGLTEYAIILSLIAVAAIGTASFFGGAIKNKIATLTAAISGDNSQIAESERNSKNAAKRAVENGKRTPGMAIGGNQEQSSAQDSGMFDF